MLGAMQELGENKAVPVCTEHNLVGKKSNYDTIITYRKVVIKGEDVKKQIRRDEGSLPEEESDLKLSMGNRIRT